MISLVPLLLFGLWPSSEYRAGECVGPPDYYSISLLPTRRVPEARQATGSAQLSFVESPFGVALSRSGHYRYRLDIRVSELRPVKDHVYVAWLATPNLKEYRRLGLFSAEHELSADVSWNKFIVFVTLESIETSKDEAWQGPVVLRGMSRSGLMHTMAGHGPYEQEPCTVYGYY